jgi:hypothetical protein
MKGLSQDLEVAISNAIDILGFTVDIDKVDSEKLENLMKSRFYVTPPNTKSNATPQDSLCSLRLK